VSSRRGFSLVELLVAVALSTLIVGILASVSIQTQRAISVTSARDDAARAATAALDDIERDLQALLPAVAAPVPFSPAAGPPERTLRLEALDPRPASPRDRLRLLTTVVAPDGSGVHARGLVEWSLDERTPDPAGGPDTGVLCRRIVSWVGGGGTATTGGPPASVIAPRVLSFTVEWQRPDGVYAAPDGATSTGDAFVRTGQVAITNAGGQGTLVTALSGSEAALDAVPIGGELALERATGPPLRLLVRRRPAPGKALLNDRVDDAPSVRFGMFQGPTALRVSIVVPFGRGPDAGVATFSRTMSVTR
jgi:prepilin-type N-terminal cleavage/methylation domain-containing protein